ncbi:Lrp/AsnC family transcriptional regulator [Psychromarinibacter sp. C21-152]|uniref:Lrp/AsnC family transcriptional regulator n=1 Tax=Psychromarinibacter sediminicola TaxID=3033385 RepID=A0AAE3NQN8_9RHOB|nr:Lrp/AsnC family transcriptional regulator [Psychromarinibacter sediminicola]MDF0600311.1 Lrp/AsnC family transcriptional regulator [Psychromarinibacter sediminicola]
MARQPKLDGYDMAILRELQVNGRMTKVALAEAVNLSPSPCWERLKKLEAAGYITGYRAMVDVRRIAPATEVLVEIVLSGHRAEDFRRFEEAMTAAREVRTCWALGGGVDYMLRLVVADVDAYQRLMDRLLDAGLGIERYYGYIVTKPVKDGPDPLPEG